MTGRLMTRCECAELSFEEIADLASREGIEAFGLLCARTGCAGDLHGLQARPRGVPGPVHA